MLSNRQKYEFEPKLERIMVAWLIYLLKAGEVNGGATPYRRCQWNQIRRIWDHCFSSCRILGDVTSGEIVGKQLIQLDHRILGAMFQLANLICIIWKMAGSINGERYHEKKRLCSRARAATSGVDGIVP
ncbi:hypothetical protein HPP92_009486 [Vanilla planifolia]|uniref:Uncharacterized protein n=1 Tax=Vanilla planifolia TaxID=51239 RepID=A0A835V8W8_VANPL|nr:hypothetical protein HPP92_009486 [Vanilla planifolia]